MRILICRGAESLARAPDFRLTVVRLAKFGATSPRFKHYWSKHIELIRLTAPPFGSSTAISSGGRLIKQSGVSRAQDHDNRFG